ncbi:MAG: Ig-like domain-containing protein, partial [Chloroflexota bacterium]
AGDASYSSGSTTAEHDVILNKDTITRITGHSPNPSEINQSVTVSVRVVGLTTPTGTVTITGANTNCTITLTNGVGSCTVVFTSVGGKSITATYNGDSNHNTSSASVGHTVNLQATVTTITTHTPDPSNIGQTVSITVTVTGGSATPTGTVTITGSGAPCTITLINGTGSCAVIFNSVGTKTLSAVYNGDSLHATSNTTASHTVSLPIASPVPSCNLITHGNIAISGSTMTMTITNPYVFPLTTGSGTVTWNNDKGHQNGGDKTLNLLSITIGNTTVWTGTSSNVSTVPFTTPATIPPNTTVTITLTFHQSYDNLDGTENIYINVTTPGCEDIPIQS